jgi:hypothetical protein
MLCRSAERYQARILEFRNGPRRVTGFGACFAAWKTTVDP